MAVSSPTYTTCETDGDYVIRNGIDYWLCSKSSIVIEENDDNATVIIGYQKPDGQFKAFPYGTLTKRECTVRHGGGGTILMARISGITSMPVVIRVTP